MSLLRKAAGIGTTISVTAIATHSAPVLTSLAHLRGRAWPQLAGIGDPSHIALTFDDGPDPASTPLFLEILRERKVRATFFLLGQMLHRAPALGREIADAGHELAVHGWEHRNLLARGPVATHDDLARARDLIGQTAGQDPLFFRPPYGVLSTAALTASLRLKMRPVLWTAWGRDWESRATPSSVGRLVTRDLRPGGTVLLHDSDCTSAPLSWQSTLGALPELLDNWQDRGWRTGPLSEHFINR